MFKIYNHLFIGASRLLFPILPHHFSAVCWKKTQFEADNEKWDLREQPYLALEYKSSAAVKVSGNEGCKHILFTYNNRVGYGVSLQ